MSDSNHVCNTWSGMKGYCVECGVHYTDEMERRANLIVKLEDQNKEFTELNKLNHKIHVLQDSNEELKLQLRQTVDNAVSQASALLDHIAYLELENNELKDGFIE